MTGMVDEGRWLPGAPGFVAKPERTCVAPGEPEHDHEMCNDVVQERAQLRRYFDTGYRDGRHDALADVLAAVTGSQPPADLAAWLRARMDELHRAE